MRMIVVLVFKVGEAGFSEGDLSEIVNVVIDREWVNEVTNRNDGVVKTSSVCLACTPPADFTCALAFSRVIFKFNDALDAHGLRSALCSHTHAPHVDLTDVDYCDDTALLVLASDSEVVKKAGDVVYIANTAFNSYGLLLKYKHN